MRRINREINIFSLSAIDLFCSAMGAFMVISIVLFPYFRKQDQRPSQEVLAQVQATVEDLKKQNEALKKEVKDASVIALFGIVTKANSVTLLVDLSGSIAAEDKNDIDYRPRIRKICEDIINALKPTQRLQIIGFHAPNGVRLPTWQERPVLLSPAETSAAKSFVQTILAQAGGTTPTGEGLRAALQQGTEAIFLITDGAPSDGKGVRKALAEQILQDATQQNQGKAEIHSIAIGHYNAQPFLLDFLMDLAKQNRGQFIGMPDV
jgi:molybdopterin converting factor small subunit